MIPLLSIWSPGRMGRRAWIIAEPTRLPSTGCRLSATTTPLIPSAPSRGPISSPSWLSAVKTATAMMIVARIRAITRVVASRVRLRRPAASSSRWTMTAIAIPTTKVVAATI